MHGILCATQYPHSSLLTIIQFKWALEVIVYVHARCTHVDADVEMKAMLIAGGSAL